MHEVRLADWYDPFSFIVHKIFFIRLVSVSLTEARGSQINLRPGFYAVAFHILHASSLCSLVAQLTYRHIHLCCFYLLSAAWLSLSFLPFCNTFHAHLKVVGCFFFFLFCLFSWNGIWKGIKSKQVLKAAYQAVGTTGHSCSAIPLAIIDIEHSFVFCICIYIVLFFLPKHCSIQNCSVKERILGYWVAPHVISKREICF